MSDRIIVTFDKSQEDIPVLMSFRENSFVYLSNSPAITVINTITGNEAIEIWNRLTKAGVKNDKGRSNDGFTGASKDIIKSNKRIIRETR